jgi:hypothetical protein
MQQPSSQSSESPESPPLSTSPSSAPEGGNTLGFDDQGRVECLRVMADMCFVGQAGAALQQLMMKLIPPPLQPQLPLFPFVRERVLSYVNTLLRAGFSKAIARAACAAAALCPGVAWRARAPVYAPSNNTVLRRPSSLASSPPPIAITRLTPSSPACTQAFAKARWCSCPAPA